MPVCEFSPNSYNQVKDESQDLISCISQRRMVYNLFTFFKDQNLGIKKKDTPIILCGANGCNDDRLTHCEAFEDLSQFGNASEHAAFYHTFK